MCVPAILFREVGYMKKYTVLFLGLAAGLMVSGCSFLFGPKIDISATGYVTGQGTLARAVSRTITVTGTQPSTGFDNESDRATVTFDPTEMEIYVRCIIISEDFFEDPSYNDDLRPTGRRIEIPVERAVDLATASQFQPLFDVNISIGAELRGTYKFIQLLTGDDATVSGTVTVNSRTYSIADERLGLNWSGIGIPLPEGSEITISDSDKHVGIVMDLHGALMALRVDDYDPSDPYTAGWTKVLEDIDTDSKVILQLNQPVILPHATSARPNVKIFKLTFDSTQFGYADALQDVWFKVVCILDDNGILSAVGWMPIYGSQGQPALRCFEPAELYLQKIVHNADGTYSIDDVGTCPAVRERAVHFPAFRLTNDSSGATFQYGDDDQSPIIVAYVSTQIQ